MLMPTLTCMLRYVFVAASMSGVFAGAACGPAFELLAEAPLLLRASDSFS